MTPAARAEAAIQILDAWQASEAGMDRVLAEWGRRHRFAGGGDRRVIADLAYGALRRLRSSAWVMGGEWPAPGRLYIAGSLRLDGLDPADFFTGAVHAPAPLAAAEIAQRPLAAAPEAVRLDLPDWLMPHLGALGPDVLNRLRERAAVYLRVNRLKADRDTAIDALAAEGIRAEPGPLSPTCLRVTEGARAVQRSDAFAAGLIEVQDAASQAVADLAAAEPGETVLDYCAGGGGKTLALGAAMAGRGRLLAHDADAGRLAQLAPRAERAGAAVEYLAPGESDAFAGACDLVLVDAPCSGSGAWARNPDAKWRLTRERLAALAELQDRILDEAAPLVRPGGRLVYATCSMIDAENGARAASFVARTGGFREAARRAWTPSDGGDGFFAAVLQKE